MAEETKPAVPCAFGWRDFLFPGRLVEERRARENPFVVQGHRREQRLARRLTIGLWALLAFLFLAGALWRPWHAPDVNTTFGWFPDVALRNHEQIPFLWLMPIAFWDPGTVHDTSTGTFAPALPLWAMLFGLALSVIRLQLLLNDTAGQIRGLSRDNMEELLLTRLTREDFFLHQLLLFCHRYEFFVATVTAAALMAIADILAGGATWVRLSYWVLPLAVVGTTMLAWAGVVLQYVIEWRLFCARAKLLPPRLVSVALSLAMAALVTLPFYGAVRLLSRGEIYTWGGRLPGLNQAAGIAGGHSRLPYAGVSELFLIGGVAVALTAGLVALAYTMAAETYARADEIIGRRVLGREFTNHGGVRRMSLLRATLGTLLPVTGTPTAGQPRGFPVALTTALLLVACTGTVEVLLRQGGMGPGPVGLHVLRLLTLSIPVGIGAALLAGESFVGPAAWQRLRHLAWLVAGVMMVPTMATFVGGAAGLRIHPLDLLVLRLFWPLVTVPFAAGTLALAVGVGRMVRARRGERWLGMAVALMMVPLVTVAGDLARAALQQVGGYGLAVVLASVTYLVLVPVALLVVAGGAAARRGLAEH